MTLYKIYSTYDGRRTWMLNAKAELQRLYKLKPYMWLL